VKRVEQQNGKAYKTSTGTSKLKIQTSIEHETSNGECILKTSGRQSTNDGALRGRTRRRATLHCGPQCDESSADSSRGSQRYWIDRKLNLQKVAGVCSGNCAKADDFKHRLSCRELRRMLRDCCLVLSGDLRTGSGRCKQGGPTLDEGLSNMRPLCLRNKLGQMFGLKRCIQRTFRQQISAQDSPCMLAIGLRVEQCEARRLDDDLAKGPCGLAT